MNTVVFRNGRIIAGYSPSMTEHRSLAIQGDRIIAVDEAAEALSSDATVIDLNGDVLAPTFGDGHVHPTLGGLETVGPLTRPCRSVDEIVAEVKRWPTNTPIASGFAARATTLLSPLAACSTPAGSTKPFPTARCGCAPGITTRCG